MKNIILYHGSTDTINAPRLGLGKKNNDYGSGFYCTRERDLAGEWACKSLQSNGYINEYSINLKGLKVLDLTKYNILHWMALLVNNRTFTINKPIRLQGKEYLLENFLIDTSEYDLIIGYRADDSYFSFAEDFLDNSITVRHLESAMKLGKLGLQYVLISDKAFGNLAFTNSYFVDANEFYTKFIERDTLARKSYDSSKISTQINSDDVFLMDIIRRGIKEWQ